MQQSGFEIYSLGEQALTVSFGSSINEALLQRVGAMQKAIAQNPFPGLIDMVPAYATLSVFFDAVEVRRAEIQGNDAFEQVSYYIRSLKVNESAAKASARTITIPVCYGGTFGPDLSELAAVHQLSINDVIKLHTKAIYKVYMMGFVPGFAYLGGMDAKLESPRRATPRKAIPAGSVGIAGGQTGIYPLETPGGWQLIGCTPVRMFDASRAEPSVLQAGDQVKFQPISEAEFYQYQQA